MKNKFVLELLRWIASFALAQRRPAANETHAEAEDGVDGGCFGHAPSAEN